MSRILTISQHSMRKNPTSSQCHGRPCFLSIYVFISGLLCLLQAGLVDAADPFACPTDCECTFKKDAIRKWINVTCEDVNLLEIPTQKKDGEDVLALNLTRNNITTIADSLQYFINLDSLDLSHNLISMLMSDSFSTLTNLITLDLSYNQITFLMSDVFANLTNLSTLSLEGNDLMYMSPAVFELQSLVTLNLARNPNITFPPGVDPTDSFTHFIISHCSLDTFPTNLLSSSENLKYLDMSHNSITSLPADVLSSNTKLEYLDISHNAISTVDKNFMSDSTNLLTLDLSNNEISDLDDKVFKKQKNLKSIDLSNNNLTTLEKKLFDDCDVLKTLDLSYNQIRDLEKDVFKKQESLESVDLSNNFLTTIDKDSFDDCVSLQTINLSNNQLTSIDKDSCKNLENLKSVDLSNNFLTAIDKDSIKDCVNLQAINLSNNEMTNIDKDSFKNLANLQSIDLSNNHLTAIDKDLFDECYNLSTLDASDNSLESVDSDAFRDIQQLTHLDLSKNDITSIEAAMFNDITGLQFLDLSYNSLTSIPVDVFSSLNVFTSLTGELVLNITHNEDLICTCDGRNYLYTLRYNSLITLYDEDAIHCYDEDIQMTVDYLDYYTPGCRGNLGWNGCNAATHCYARNSDCNDSQNCVCKENYYDNNGDDEDGGECKPMVDLGYPCDRTAACQKAHSECDSYVCKCKMGYYDTNLDTSLGGDCNKTVELGEVCSTLVDNSCAPDNSHCDGTTQKCVCDSTHYDSNENQANGTCIEKHLLDQACNATYQCAPENSECNEDDGICICSNDFYDIKGDKTSCQGASSFFSCYQDETDGGDKPVEFSELKTVSTMDECKEHCFAQNLRHVTMETGTSVNYCLCGTTGSTITGCCPYTSGAASCTTSKKKAGDITYVTSELSLSSIPLLTTGKAHLFTASAALSLIDQIKWNFGDTESEHTVDASTSNYYHTYTRSGKFILTISACMKSAPVCDSAQVPVIVQVPSFDQTMWLTGYQKADVAKSVTDMTATFTQGYDFDYTFSRTDSSGATIYSKGCESGWVTHRQKCLKLYSTSSKYAFSLAQLMCQQSKFSGAQILEINFQEEISEIATLLSLSTSSSSHDRVYINAQKQSNGAYEWLSDSREAFFTAEHLDDPSLGDNVVIDASTGHLTSSDPNTKQKVICMKDPVDCPYGGINAANGNCYALSSATKNWEDAKDDCINSYEGRLANLKDKNIHGNVSSLLTGGISEAWIGLSDRSLEGYYTWSDDISYDISGSYQPTITSLDEDCFVVKDASTWNTDSCYSVKRYVCEYSIRNERLTVPSYLAGTNDIGVAGNQDLEQVVGTSSFTPSSGTKEVTLFPGMWITRSGNIHSWKVHTTSTNMPGTKYNLALHVYRPHCLSSASPTLIQPGCDNNMFANCTASSLTCTSSSSCDDTEYFCYLSNQCKPFSESCTCKSESGQQACQNSHSVTDAGPTFKLVGQTMVEVELVGERYLTIPADSVPVQEGDVLGFEIEAGKNVIKCENLSTSNLQQRSYVASVSDWYMAKVDDFPSAAASDLDQTCYFHAIYTQDIAKNLTTYLGSFDSTGSYSLSIEIPYSSYSRTLSVTLDEAIGDIKWVYPQKRENSTDSTSLGTIYIESGIIYNFTLSIGRGTTLTTAFSIDLTTATENLYRACPADALTEVPSLCDTDFIWSHYPFSYFSHMVSTTGTQNLTVTISNSIGTETRIVTLKIAKRVTNVAISCTSSSNNIVAINDAGNFSTSVGDGTGLSYAYSIDGVSVPGTIDTMTHTFSAVGNINVTVTVSNILGSSSASLSMTVILPANFQKCQFTIASYIAAVNVSLTMSVTCEVVLTAVVQASWSFSDRPSAAPLTSTEAASISTTVTWTQAVVFSSASSSVKVNVTYTDQINFGSISTDVTVYEAVPSVSLVAMPLKALLREYINFTASVPQGIYGNLTFDFEFGNTATDSANATDSNPIGEVSYFYTNTGSYYVKVIASNGPSQAEMTIQVVVVETIQGLTITSDSPTKTTELTTIKVNVNQGNYGIVYNFVSDAFNINATQSSFSYVFPQQGNYTVNVTAMNGLTEESASVMVYIMDETTIYASDLQIDGGSFSSCIESNTEHEFDVTVIHFDTSGLLYKYDFGDSNIDSSVSKVKHTYATGNNFTLTLTVKYPTVANAQVVLSETLCVQDPISSPTIVVDQKIGLPPSGTVTKIASVTVTGTDPVYSWATNASYTGSTTGSTFNLEFSATGFYSIDVNVSNAINLKSAQTVIVEVLNAVSGLTIACSNSSNQPCFDKAGHVYVEQGDSFSVSASLVSGDAVTYSWTFGDGSGSLNGQTVTKTYPSTGIYNVTVEATNDAGSELKYITVHAEERLTTVSLDKYGTIAWLLKTSEPITEKNKLTEFEAVESPSGMEVEYHWEFGDSSTQSTSTGITGHNYTSTGLKQCVVTVQNFLNSVSKTFDFHVIEEITSVNLRLNGTEVSGTSKSVSVAVNKLIVFEMFANTDVRCTYMFSLRKDSKYVDSKANYTWGYTFSILGDYTLDTRVTNDLGAEATTFDIKVIEEITNPVITVTAGGPSNTLGTSITLEASAQGTSPVYTWLYKQAPVGESIPSSTSQQITLTPTAVGTYVVQLNVTNDVTDAQTAEYTFVVLEAVAGVSILSTLDPPDAVKINTLVTFNTLVMNGSDLSYAWSIDSNTGSLSSFSFNFTAQKLYTVSVNVSNSASWVVETIQIYCLDEVPAFTLSVSGSTFHPTSQAAETGDTLVFSSSLASATFITFSWTLNAVSSGATTFSHTFTAAGSYDIALNASNKISFSVSQITVVIQDPIAGLTVSNCRNTFAMNTDVTLTATYIKGTDVTIDWDMESLLAASGDSTVINYGTPGTYTVNATASNFVGTKVVSCQIEVQGKIDNLIIDHSKYLFADFSVTFNVTGDYFDSASFSWSVSGNPTPVITTVPIWDYKFLTKGDYTVTVNVSNAVSSKEVSLTVTITELECTVPTLTIADGITDRTVTRSSEIELTVTVSNAICSAYTSVNKWTLYNASSCSEALTNEYPLANDITTTTPSLNIPGKTLPYGTYCAVFEHSYKNTPVYNSAAFNLTIIESSLVAIITGGDTKDVGEGSELHIDASESHDPDDTTTTLSYTWACQVTTASSTGSSDLCSAVGATTSVSADLTGITLTAGDVYVITLTVSAASRTSSTAQTLSVTSAGSPEVSISCISCSASGYYCVSNSRSVKLRGTCTSGCDGQTSYFWTVVPAVDSSKTATGFNKKNLVIKRGGLTDGVNYTFTLTATSGSKSGSVSKSFTACSIPHSGTCIVYPTSVVLLTDLVTVECKDWKDDSANMVFRYKVVIQNYDDINEEYTAYDGTSATIQTYVSPWPGSAKVFMFVYVLNDFRSGKKFAAPVITFTSPSFNPGITMTDFIVSNLQGNMMAISQQNNPVGIMQYIAAVLNILNEQSAIAASAGDETELYNRTAVRDLVATVIEGLPTTTTFQIQLMATIAEFLTAYEEEIQVTTTLDSTCDLVKTLTTQLSSRVVQGMEQTDLQPNSLLKAQSKVSSAYLHGSSGMTSSASSLFGNLQNYVPPISVKSQNSVVYTSEQERMQTKVEEMLDVANAAIKIPLLSMLADEEEFSLSFGTTVVHAQRASISLIWTQVHYSGLYLKVPTTIFSHTGYNKDDVLQIIKVNADNPLGFNQVPDAPVNTYVADALFMDSLSGAEISVSSLPNDDQVMMYIFTNQANVYDIDSSSLINSTLYDPFSNTDGTTWHLEADRTVEAAISRVHQDAAAIHIQIKVEFLGCVGKLNAKLLKDDIPLTDADGEGVRPREITQDMISGQLDHRDFSFFDKAGTSESAYKVELASSCEVNVTVSVYYSLCQFYNPTSSSWDTQGCEPTDESIADCIACRCNHMTSYGGSVLLSPDQIDFTDITRLDIPSNPVAIIVCSVILGLYIVLMIVCKKLDIMDVQRISTIPLCGKDGSFKYEVTMVTGRQVGAGTTANVGCRIIGEYGKSAPQHLNKKGAFKRNCSDSFIMAYDVNLGEIKKVSVWHDNRGTSPSWYLDHVIIKDLQTDKKYYFLCTSWLTLEEEKGSIQKEIRAASSAEMKKFGRQMKTATYNSLADKHLWLSLMNRPAQSRFTRVQRATCCVTLLYTFIAVNAMWYGLVKKNNSATIVGDFGWEEVVVGLVSNLMVFPINIGIIFLFKKSRSKSTLFDHGSKPQTAETIEIENLCDNSQSGSFQSSAYGGVPIDLERESTMESLPRNATATALHRSRPVKSQRDDADNNVKKPLISATPASAKGPMWNQDSIMKWPEKMPYSEDGDMSRPSTSSTTVTHVKQAAGKSGSTGPQRKTSGSGTADSDELLKYLDEMESDLKDSEERSAKGSAGRKPSRKPSVGTSRWGSLEDILNSDDESAITDNSKKKLKKNSSTTSQTSQDKKFNPRDDPKLNGNSRWLKSRESNASGSMIGGEHFYYSRGHISSEAGIAAGLKPGYNSEMTMRTQDIPVLPDSREKCTLPSWCIYIAYVLCFLLCAFSIVLVILYCFKFGYEESLEWVLALIFALFQSFLLIEPVKAVFIAVYMVLILKKVEQDEDEDCIDIEPTFDNSSEMIKDVKFKPISGFALMQAKEEGQKMHRMKVMLRQFIAYIFYLWLLMVIVYVNFPYSSYLLTKHVENSFVHGDDSNGSVIFNNISSIEDFWDWTENTFADAVHLQDSNTDEEHGFLLGVARMRLIRSTTITCEPADSAGRLGASSLTDRTCYGYLGFEEDTTTYGEGWNDSYYNYSWKHSSGNELRGGHKVGHVATYGGGGYSHNLGTTLSQTQTIIQDLRSKDWVDLRTRAVILELAIYSPGTDMTALVALLLEFPLTGSAIASYEIQTQKLLWFQEGRVDPLMICEVILLLVTVYSLVHIVVSIRDHGKQFFKDFWNWYEMLTTLMTMVAIGMYLGCVVEATNTFNHLLADKTGFTNFERVMYVHVGMRYLHAWLLFLLMYKVVKQLRFIKFMHIYEKTISTAVGQLLAVGLIFIILLLIYAQLGYLMYGQIPGFDSVGHAIVTLIVMIRGTFDFWPMLDYQPIFSHFYVYSYYAFTYGLTIALVIAILNNMYKRNRSQMYYKATLDMQDYEMIDFMMKRFKLWAGMQKEKPAFRRVKFQGLPSISSRSSSSYTNQTSSSSSHQSSSVTGPEYSRAQLNSMMSRLGPTWLACVKRFDRILDLDKEEDTLVKKAESEVKEINFRLRVNGLENERRELLNWTKTDKPPDQNQRQSAVKTTTTNKDSKKPPTSLTFASRTSGTPPATSLKAEGSQTKGKRPLSDQGARIDLPAKGKSSGSEPKTLQKFFQQIKPSKPAWNNNKT